MVTPMLRKFFMWALSLGALMGLAALVGLFIVVQHFSIDLPDYKQLANYQPAITTRVHAGDGRLMEEFAQEKRVFVPINAVAPLVKNAFLAAEDQHFYTHPGIDFYGIMRAVVTNLQSLGSNRRPVGGSTITQQVAKNFLLGGEVSYKRKIREAILAFRMEKTFTKDQILELYLNQIYLGKGRYGVAAAALGYFNKSLTELTAADVAYLAALPKAPNNYQLDSHPKAALSRRNWVLRRMYEDGHIDKTTFEQAKQSQIVLSPQTNMNTVDTRYFNEEVRRDVAARYGEAALYQGGLSVRTSLNPVYQAYAADALTNGLIAYDRRHGYRGVVQHLDSLNDWSGQLEKIERPKGAKAWALAVVLKTSASNAELGLVGDVQGTLPSTNMAWTGRTPTQLFKNGDVILVSANTKTKDTYDLQQVPKVQGALMVMDPHTGRILAMQGGFDYDLSEFNRATQAKRQPGSSFKPFVYLAALNNGFTPSNLVLDGPVAFDQGPGLGVWRPENYSEDYLGLTTLRVGLELSRNLMTVRLAQYIGMTTVADFAQRFGIFDKMPRYLAYALGSGETTLQRMVGAYAMIANGGKKINPSLIDRIQDRTGKTVFQTDKRACAACGTRIAWENQAVPKLKDDREQLADPRTVYQMTSMLEGVVQRGTAQKLKDIGRPVAGKTGTTNDYKDAWFIGFTPDLAVGAYIGFDEPKNLGKGETGGTAVVPIIREFLSNALKDQPATPFRVPSGLAMLKVNARNGQITSPADPNGIWEAFIPGTEPGTGNNVVLDSAGVATGDATGNSLENTAPDSTTPDMGTGGIY